MLALIDSQLGAVDPASRQSAAAEIVAALIAAAKAGKVKAITAEQDKHERRLAAAEAALEEERRQAERNEEIVQAILSAYPEVNPELAARFVRASVALMAPRNLTDVLRERLGLWQPVPPDESTLGTWRDMGLPGDPGPERLALPEPEPELPYRRPEPMIRPKTEPPTPAGGPEPAPQPEPPSPDPKQWILPGSFLGMGDLTVEIPDKWRQ